jgi:hypothetical protein
MTSRFNPTRQLQRSLTTLATVFTLTISTFGMNKAELVDAIAGDANLSKADAKRALDAFIGTTSFAFKKRRPRRLGRVRIVLSIQTSRKNRENPSDRQGNSNRSQKCRQVQGWR